LLDDLHTALTTTGKAALNQGAALAGLGGVGKTQTAVEYAYRYFYDEAFYQWVFWVKADTELALITDLAAIARSLDLGDGTLEELATRSRQWLAKHPHWLLIFDNADQPEIVKPWLPRNPQGRVLLTSRAQRFTSLGIQAPIAVQKLSLEESIAFLRDRTQPRDQDGAQSAPPDLDAAELAAATALAQELDGLPLAMEQAAAYIDRALVSSPQRFAVYWQAYQHRQLALLQRSQPQTGDYPQTVQTTWVLNFEQVQNLSPAAVPILHLSAVLAADDIPEFLLLEGAAEFGFVDGTDELALAEQLATLADFSLIQRERDKASYSIHRMVQAVIWQGLTEAEQQDWLHRAIAGLSAVFPDPEQVGTWAICGQLTPHVQAIAALPTSPALDTPPGADLLNQTGGYLYAQGRYDEAKPLYRRSLQIREQQLGADHPDVATSLNNLAELYRVQGRYGEAKPLYLRSLQIKEQQLGADHPDTALSLNNLAFLYESQGRYGEAEPLLVRSLQIWEQQLGSDHPHVATSLNNLAALYYAQGRYGEAEPLYRQSLQIREQQLGADHPAVAISLNNLAALYRAQGRYGEAEPLYRRSLEIVTIKLGLNHPSTQQTQENLAILYDNMATQAKLQGRYDKAVEFLEKAIALRQFSE
jgi:tetratricopeptide (TPR) repeat protein